MLLCIPCLKKSKVPKKGLVIKPMIFSEMNSSAQVDLIDMQSQPDGDLKRILVYQDHLTKSVQLGLVKSKRAPGIVYQLFDIFSIFRARSILQSDNGRGFVNSVITELSEMWVGLKLIHGKPKHSQRQGSVERVNRGIKDVLTTWLQSNLITHWCDGLRFVQLMKNRAYHKGIKCSSYEAMLVQPMKVGLKTSNLPDDAIEDIFSKEEFEKVVSGEHRDEQNNLTQDPIEEIHIGSWHGTRNDLVDNTDMEVPVFVDVQKETGAADLPSTEMVTEIALSP